MCGFHEDCGDAPEVEERYRDEEHWTADEEAEYNRYLDEEAEHNRFLDEMDDEEAEHNRFLDEMDDFFDEMERQDAERRQDEIDG